MADDTNLNLPKQDPWPEGAIWSRPKWTTARFKVSADGTTDFTAVQMVFVPDGTGYGFDPDEAEAVGRRLIAAAAESRRMAAISERSVASDD